ncbi:FTR1 family protein [Corynebacterium phoceense]|uniref:iron uptake transporter permease EfeU n=1 Tax=Corynebacterium TaxID=1716 RepID=UPI0007969AED|nr:MULTISPECIES: iron uptake transporter permease EfeU [Corynebacterium]KXB53693.1 FTR1 family protein [Corynebacterium sp. DNF00584]MCQ9330264.1 FTR1 family protein [Corynebacterium phoceense]MCQ9347421.1 FTR1 family protein [Corynebacterium phoceense]OFL77278.1 iron transporter [Corynebacterium sp. HMSC077B05]OFP17095.1 iron transporter [Corynebacterium sp. HMSC065A05]
MLFANLLIGLREGLEAAMVVTILAAYLTKSGHSKQMRWVWAGVAAAIAVTLAVFAIIYYGTKTLTTVGQEIIGGIGSLVAVALVSYMLLWMHGASKNMKAELEGKLEHAIAVGPGSVFVLAFMAVVREGIETALLVFDTFAYGSSATPALGLSLGIAIAVAVAVAMYFGAIRINLRTFFRVTGILLVIVAAGILRYGLTDLQEAGLLPGLHTLAFDVSHIIAPGTALATFIEGIFNLVPAPTTLSMVGWAVYLVIALYLFLRPTKKA